ncbi:glutamate-gated chloride channel 1 protein-like protein [Leptotrombidium deliense]|uniref:Glutamate-gated chloride channel 1 protein-like protein n=1 Tax=Leptotrombidium deliense TaxID=299467 RepID=A0A443SRA7_9ACAR|nr:glutamate-gated chloride channel 1 protein-like protein [Leptotrombidium deliense]
MVSIALFYTLNASCEYATQITFREEWRDSRLVYDDKGGQIKFLTLTDPEKIWKPDLFFSNEKTGHTHDIIMPNMLLRIYPNGDVLFSIRISLVLFCPMHLKYFPLDMQTCIIKMANGYTTEDLVFLWKAGDPVQITKKLNLPRFTLMKYLTKYCTSRTNTGEYSCLEVDLIFKREFSYYLILIYVPCCMLVIVSWVSFWIDPNSAAARVMLGVTSLLTMSRQISGINASLPPVSYTKAVDVWTGCCLTFVFGALLEFAVVNYVSRSDAHKLGRKGGARRPILTKVRKKWEPTPGKDSGIESDDLDDGPVEYARALGATKIPKDRKCSFPFGSWLSRFPTRSKRIDVMSRICFPLLFAIFNVFYWTTYLMRKELQDLEN